MHNSVFRKLRIGLLGLVLTYSSVAAGFCRTTTCSPRTAAPEQGCTSDDNDCPATGIPLSWRTGCVSFSVQSSGSEQRHIDFEQARRIAEQVFDTWLSADCGAGTPSLEWTDMSPAECGQGEYNRKAPNANVILFRDDEWPHDNTGTTVALTIVTQNLKTGEIYDADIEINSAEQKLTTGNDNVEFDLQSVLTHEVGHFLGLDDTTIDPRTTMYWSYNAGDTSPRQLSADDVRGVCSIYPPGDAPASVRCSPRHGFSAECAANESSGCSCTAPNGSGVNLARGLAAPCLLFGVLSVRRRRRVTR